VIQRQLKSGSDDVEVRFLLPAASVLETAAVVGDFNRWDPSATTFRRRRGQWTASITVPVGRRYAFRYLSGDGSWFNDDEADDYEPNPFGGHNCVLDLTEVEEPVTQR
jgi:1,4-alpha-glucan branching enzyme